MEIFRVKNFHGFRGSVIIHENINRENFKSRDPRRLRIDWDRTSEKWAGPGCGQK